VVYDHDYPHLAEGSVVPHGIYDLQKNDAMINIGVCAAALRINRQELIVKQEKLLK